MKKTVLNAPAKLAAKAEKLRIRSDNLSGPRDATLSLMPFAYA